MRARTKSSAISWRKPYSAFERYRQEKHGWSVTGEYDTDIGTITGRMPQRVWRMEKSIG